LGHSVLIDRFSRWNGERRIILSRYGRYQLRCWLRPQLRPQQQQPGRSVIGAIAVAVGAGGGAAIGTAAAGARAAVAIARAAAAIAAASTTVTASSAVVALGLGVEWKRMPKFSRNMAQTKASGCRPHKSRSTLPRRQGRAEPDVNNETEKLLLS
jgi:hypothetical protein